ncbi:hypothetical protein R6Q57_001371 [Mikania cordata]
MLTLEPFSKDQSRSAVHPTRGIPPINFLTPCGPVPGARRCRSTPLQRALPTTIGTTTSPQAYQQHGLWTPYQSAPVHAPSRSADRLSPFHIRPGRITGPHSLPSRQFQALFDSLFKVLFIFPSRYLFAIGLTPVFSLGRNLPPYWGCFPKQPDSKTVPRGATGSGHDGALTSLAPPSRGLGLSPSLRTLLQTTIQTTRPSDFQAGLFPVRSPLLRESFDKRTTQDDCLINHHQSCVPRQGTRISANHATGTGDQSPPNMQHSTVRLFCYTGFDNDLSAGSPTETLLRLLLPLNDKVQWNSRDVAGSEPPTSPRS